MKKPWHEKAWSEKAWSFFFNYQAMVVGYVVSLVIWLFRGCPLECECKTRWDTIKFFWIAHYAIANYEMGKSTPFDKYIEKAEQRLKYPRKGN